MLLKSKGGLYKSDRNDLDSVFFSLYTGVEFGRMDCGRQGVSTQLLVETPSGKARDQSGAKRAQHWESVGRKKLMRGGLVALIWKTGSSTDSIRIYLGTLNSSLDDIVKHVKNNKETIKLAVSFFDAEADLRILRSLQNQGKPTPKDETRLLVEAPVMFEAIRPFLETLKTAEPSEIPFSRYIAFPDTGSLDQVALLPPAYATPRFAFDLRMLFDPSARIDLWLRPHDVTSIANARAVLKQHSRLDSSQADAMVDTLTSEIALIQG